MSSDRYRWQAGLSARFAAKWLLLCGLVLATVFAVVVLL